MATKSTQTASAPRAYTSVNLVPAAVDRLRRMTYCACAAAGRRVPMSDVVAALCVLAERHAQELAEIITPDSQQEGTASR